MFLNRKISGIYKEFSVPFWIGTILIAAAAATIYLPWLNSVHELFRNESIQAAIAKEFSLSAPVPTAHHVQLLSEGILFPAITSLLHRCTGMAMETALRTVSITMLVLTAVIAGLCASVRNTRAGLVAAAVTISSVLVIDKAAEGYPTTTNALLLLSAQAVFFHYGIRKTNWNMAWLLSTALITLAFFSGGFRMLIYFIFPMLFFRRPLSVKSKFRKPGFVIAVAALSVIIAGYLLHFSINTGKAVMNELMDSGIQTSDYWQEVLVFPFMFPVRLLPWSIIAWLPFCVALQAIDPTPIFSRYLRTLTISTLVLLWLMPFHDAREILYLLGPLAIQTGIYYDLGMSRYGNRIRKFLIIGELLAVILLCIFLCVILLPENIIGSVFSISSSLAFRNSDTYRIELFSAIGCCIALGIFFFTGRRSAPVWMLLLTLATLTGLFYGSVIYPYRAQDQRKRQLASDIKAALANENAQRLYKYDIQGFYGGLFYTGLPIYQLNNVTDLPENANTVYLVSTKFPQTLDRKWSNLLAPNYTYQKEKLYLWKGVLKDENYLPF